MIGHIIMTYPTKQAERFGPKPFELKQRGDLERQIENFRFFLQWAKRADRTKKINEEWEYYENRYGGLKQLKDELSELEAYRVSF